MKINIRQEKMLKYSFVVLFLPLLDNQNRCLCLESTLTQSTSYKIYKMEQ